MSKRKREYNHFEPATRNEICSIACSPVKKQQMENISNRSEGLVKEIVGSEILSVYSAIMGNTMQAGIYCMSIRSENGNQGIVLFGRNFMGRHMPYIVRRESKKRFRTENKTATSGLDATAVVGRKIVKLKPIVYKKRQYFNQEWNYNVCTHLEIVLDNGLSLESYYRGLKVDVYYNSELVTVPYSHFSNIDYAKSIKWSKKCVEYLDVVFRMA